jgi:hypothetical protein
VCYSLANLNLTNPLMGSPTLLTVVALSILNYKLNSKGLLQDGADLNFLLHSKLKLDSSAMRLSIDKLCVQKFDTL